MITLNWSILTVKGAENTPRGPGPFFYDHRFGTYDFYKKNVCAALKLEVNDPVIMQQIRLSLDGLAGLGCCYV